MYGPFELLLAQHLQSAGLNQSTKKSSLATKWPILKKTTNKRQQLKKKCWTATAFVLSGLGASHIIHTQTPRQKDLDSEGLADLMGISLQLETQSLSN